MKEKNVYRIIVWAGVAGLAVWFFGGSWKRIGLRREYMECGCLLRGI